MPQTRQRCHSRRRYCYLPRGRAAALTAQSLCFSADVKERSGQRLQKDMSTLQHGIVLKVLPFIQFGMQQLVNLLVFLIQLVKTSQQKFDLSQLKFKCRQNLFIGALEKFKENRKVAEIVFKYPQRLSSLCFLAVQKSNICWNSINTLILTKGDDFQKILFA